ncbi:MAG TPA: hypothetical protein VIX81_03060 [Gammaproteobacteria bacterium]
MQRTMRLRHHRLHTQGLRSRRRNCWLVLVQAGTGRSGDDDPQVVLVCPAEQPPRVPPGASGHG